MKSASFILFLGFFLISGTMPSYSKEEGPTEETEDSGYMAAPPVLGPELTLGATSIGLSPEFRHVSLMRPVSVESDFRLRREPEKRALFGINFTLTPIKPLEGSMQELSGTVTSMIQMANDPNSYFRPSDGMIQAGISMLTWHRDFKYNNMAEYYAAYGIQGTGGQDCDLQLSINPDAWRDHMKIFDQQQCFKNRKVKADDAQEDKALIFADEKSCDCVKNTPINQAAWPQLEKEAELSPGGTLLANAKTNVNNKVLGMTDDWTAMMIQASSLGGSRENAELLAAKYTQNLKDAEPVIENARERIKVVAETKTAEAEPNGKFSESIDKLSLMIVPPKEPDVVLKKMEDYASDCLTMQMYLKKKQTQVGVPFLNALEASKGKFKETDWNYKSLKAEYDALQAKILDPDQSKHKATNLKESNQIKAKLTFLIRNPLIKNLFNAAGKDLPDLETPPGKDKKDVLNEKKQSLLKIVYDQFITSKKDCGTIKLKCQEDKLLADSKEYNRALGEFFAKEDVTYITRMSSTAALEDGLNDNELNGLFKPTTPTTRSGIELAVWEEYKITTDDCVGENIKDMKACVQAFTKYCPKIEKAAEAIRNKTEEIPSAVLEREQRAVVSLDPVQNRQFNRERKAQCVDERVDKEGKRFNYTQYKQKHCTGISNYVCFRKFRKMTFTINRMGEEKTDGNGWTEGDNDSDAANDGDTQVTSTQAKTLQGIAKSAKDSRNFTKEDFTKAKAAFIEQKLAESGKPIDPAAKSDVTPTKAEVTADPATATSFTGASTTALATPMALPATEVRKLLDSTEEEKKTTTKAHEDLERKAAEVPVKDRSSPAYLEMQKKMADLEVRLKKQTDDIESYKRILAQKEEEGSAEEDTEDPAVAKANPKGAPTKGAGSKGAKGGADEAFRAPAGIMDGSTGGAASAGGGGGGGGSFGAAGPVSKGTKTSAAAGKMNEALLAKYGVSVPASSTGSIVLAEDREAKQLPILRDANAQVVPLNVSPAMYEKIKKKDLGTLEKIYEEKLKDLSSTIVKISVRAEGQKDALEFYAIKENGKVVFQPVRKFKRTNLINEINEVKKT